MQIKNIILMFLAQGLVACSVVPGMHMSPFSDESSIEMPTKEKNAAILKELNIQTITAQTIIDLEKNFNNYSLGPNNVANLYFDWRIGSKATKGSQLTQKPRQYRVGPRDILTITVWDHPELTIPAGSFRSAEAAGNVVGEDGNFYYPYVGVVKAAGKTVEEIRTELSAKLSKYIERVQLDVRVTTYRSQRAYIVGEVKQPGIQLVRDIPLTVLEAINNAGGVTSEADQRSITLSRDDKTYNINLLALYEGGDIRQNVTLQHGDVLSVPDRQFNKIFVLGDTGIGGLGSQRSRSVYMNKGRMTLTEAISEAGGPTQDASDPARIFIFRTDLGEPKIYHLDAKSPDALLLGERFPLQPRDIIFIDRAEGIRWNQIINQIEPTVALVRSIQGVF
ncbi:sugar transporter [Methyloprofundus sedimenti]|uniref:Sugar transporter n=1 Tax=Methyloprofundus sedimenti TaxID=1420851 RepID=A0A1V8M8P7_9GAMM|nr:polysaccharide biosynthesis/export family protein [Methyloprofundus sedimenti]OQK17892.1 sugar transporter [Methyloprofundus sedimenti]